ncbi:MAG: alpha/beta hydrolase [Ornithinibacter sp.]
MTRSTPLDERAIAWSHGPGTRSGLPLVVFMHGFSGREDDWSAWFSALPAGVVGASLRAPLPVGDRWAWVRFDGPGTTTSRLRSDYAAGARGIGAWLERQEADRVALVGWSQGGAMAVQLLRQHPDRFLSTAVVAGFVANTAPHAGLRARRPAVWYGMGGRDDVIPPARATRSRRWLADHTTATFVDFPDDGHLLSPTLVRAAMTFTAAALQEPKVGSRFTGP